MARWHYRPSGLGDLTLLLKFAYEEDDLKLARSGLRGIYGDGLDWGKRVPANEVDLLKLVVSSFGETWGSGTILWIKECCESWPAPADYPSYKVYMEDLHKRVWARLDRLAIKINEDQT